MRNFTYQCIDQNGRNVAGQMLAPDEASLEERLKAIGLWLVDARAEKIPQKKTASAARGSFLATRPDAASSSTSAP